MNISVEAYKNLVIPVPGTGWLDENTFKGLDISGNTVLFRPVIILKLFSESFIRYRYTKGIESGYEEYLKLKREPFVESIEWTLRPDIKVEKYNGSRRIPYCEYIREKGSNIDEK